MVTALEREDLRADAVGVPRRTVTVCLTILDLIARPWIPAPGRPARGW